MNNKILHLVKQLEESEKVELYNHIKWQYGREEKSTMLRDDIKDRVIELMESEFGLAELEELDKFEELTLDNIDITAFAEDIIKSFDLEKIQFAEIMKWEKIGDIVNTVEDILECVINEPFISAFEIET